MALYLKIYSFVEATFILLVIKRRLLCKEKKRFCFNLNNSLKILFMCTLGLCDIVLSVMLVFTIHLAFITAKILNARAYAKPAG